MKRFCVKTLGCKVNQCESEAICNALVEAGAGFAYGTDGQADLVIVNTCTVTRKAAMQSRQAVRQAIRNNPGARIVVTGCHAQIAPAELAAIDGVDRVVGNGDKHQIPRQILAGLPAMDASPETPACGDVRAIAQFDALPGIAHGGRTRPFLKVQDGCDAFCTYCIVPHARGRSRSLPVDQVLDQIGRLGRLGYREVVLTGIHIGCYGKDLSSTTGLYDLLCRIREAGTINRVRLSSIEPAELSDEIIGLADADPNQPGRLCPHFHVPLQSGDDGILKRMHRPYTRDFFRGRVHAIIHRVPHAAIGVDTLIGFPGETDAAFENTHQLISSLPVTYLHVFPFSAREGTPAFSFSGQIPAPVIKNRCRRMRRLGEEKRRGFYHRRIGETVTVLVEETRDKGDGRLKGLTDNYVPVRFDGPDEWYNTLRTVSVNRISGDGLPEGTADTGE
ncbi:tRNA (N(6)-L-threonylcarbamoyladenosine(37)-C(2))-methylthiotran sferase MtaB [Desulfosarcina ovata subsp. sediminis]|uniref:tRNA (N(6)-L-threonylcarbamoyladenosine(37)-C(2) )-methylthiotran sferase MtaB n=1 Tax=Desulfosarcina ovata subsp. sediminis TaxID=885957 RepID=A0A5K7ZKD4_9BACT|nr:tRNA (N(6)-L-threonylcarbamoyladenosine(37)-C(2))-methylthiotransferase MtaB [Desulfosarcina ovata]BBO81361.1 tRNA (N(6)-L-threonylcarbamoyladenosine(37)-C(2))-methylthiotran sferase MtaB [Desulfosarcina ovata subsp. sediminis]